MIDNKIRELRSCEKGCPETKQKEKFKILNLEKGNELGSFEFHYLLTGQFLQAMVNHCIRTVCQRPSLRWLPSGIECST